jgi:hypothetical protein
MKQCRQAERQQLKNSWNSYKKLCSSIMLTFLLVSVACLFYGFYPVQLFSLHKVFSSALQALLENVEITGKFNS